MALIIVLSVLAALAVVGIIATLIQTIKDGYGPVANRAYFRRLP